MAAMVDASGLAWANLIVGAVGAVGTIAALVVAIALGLHEVRQLRSEAAERERDRRLHQQASERSQAERVSAVARVNPAPLTRYSLGPDRPDLPTYGAYADVINSSDQPIYGAKIVFPHDGGYLVKEVGFIPGRDKGHAHLPPRPDLALDRQPLEIAFRDAADRWWSRCSEGHLQRHDEDPFPSPDRGQPG